VQHDEDVGGGDAKLAEVADQRLVQAALGLAGAAGEHRDLHQDEVVAAAWWQLEVVAGMLHDALRPVMARDAQGLHQGGVRRVQQRLLLRCRPALADLEADQWHGWLLLAGGDRHYQYRHGGCRRT
jgi:hypothetical protein